jgi:2-isopropylmalate synthase
MMPVNQTDLIFDWNDPQRRHVPIELDDETLRDGLQSPSVIAPTIDRQIELIHLMDRLGITTADIGLPGASQQAQDRILLLCREMLSLNVRPNVACRTLVQDIAPVADIQQAAGVPVEVYAFLGSSRIRGYVEDWQLEDMLKLVKEAISFCRRQNLAVAFVTEDTTRADPETLRALYRTAIEAGAKAICLCDTCGHATPFGVTNLLGTVRQIVANLGATVRIDWHGHNDRGLALVNALTAIEAGATRIHATALGIGERAGNTAMDQLLVNFYLNGWWLHDLAALPEYVRSASQAVGYEIPGNYPVFGHDAFQTSTGVHAAAIIKAMAMGNTWLADRVYSGVPASVFGLQQTITVGPMSGQSNVRAVLNRLRINPTTPLIQMILAEAKRSNHTLTDYEVSQLVLQSGSPLPV